MATFTLRKGNHNHVWPPNSTWPWIGKRSMARFVTFSPQCATALDPYHAQDANKLFGLSFGLGGVHHNSARFGWRYNADNDCIDLVAYCYLDGVRYQDEQLNFPHVAQVKIGQRVKCFVGFGPSGLLAFTVRDENDKPLGIEILPVAFTEMGKSFGLTHGLYWGGSTLCPHDMTVTIDRV